MLIIQEIESNHKVPKYKTGDRVKLIKIFLAKVTPKIGQRKYLLLILC